MKRACLCECHDTDEERHEYGVNAIDPIEAVIACDKCLNGHTGVFEVPKLARPKIVRRSPEEIAAAWEEHELEQKRKRMNGEL